MPTLDWIFLIVLLASGLLGAWRGLVYEVFSLLAWVGAFVAARWLYADVGAWLPMQGASQTLRGAVGFGLVFLVAVMLGGLVAVGLRKVLATVGLRPMDRFLGASFGLVRGVALLLLTTALLGMTPMRSALIWKESAGVDMSMKVLAEIRPMLSREAGWPG
ncbi:CvpA family protein [Candidatus Symbiobacter mobilis]|uniref:Colicin V production membrane protein n=1 Tax=Candidatus Symbiobacter mobilis CR TaxID=946483 RepID=U5NAL9_9BURK|nr:CvpA family protein [Candidatus Symbiobacter mobilis]AGX88611.1 colicin V production membrane protein [Candidatus Symbiobacter mobilis CR]